MAAPPADAELSLDAAIERWGFVCAGDLFEEELAECAAAVNAAAMLKACPAAPCPPGAQELCA